MTVRLAADVRLTRLPFGGGVLVNGRTLEITELDGIETAALVDLLAGRPPDGALAERLTGEGWLSRVT